MRRISSFLVVIVWLTSYSFSQSALDKILKAATSHSSSATLGNDKITAGLKEALQVGTTKAVTKTGKTDGFLKNAAIKILLPPKLQNAQKTLRFVGFGPQLDELEVGMNRAAEQATPQAKQIFLNALMQMSIDDARHILSGNDTAATDFFRNKSSAQLTTAFAPIVHQALQNVGVVRQYNQLRQNALAGPVLQKQNFDLDSYVVGKTLDGLFYMLGEEEKQIRKNPAAQTTALLREVFGNRPQGEGR